MSTSKRPLVWTIAGSDSGGGAGLQADLLTIHDLGAHGCSVVSSLTAQNSLGVLAAQPVALELFAQQCQALVEDMPPRAIKLGLLGSAAQAHYLREALAQWRQQWPGLGVVLDPVLVATSGDRLAHTSLVEALRSLLPFVDLVTPNIAELAELDGRPITTLANALAAGQALSKRFKVAVLVKGGHLDNGHHCEDALVEPARTWWFRQPRQPTPHCHGTGCTLSSAWAAAWSQGYSLADAVTLANAYVQSGLRTAYATGQGAGTLARTGWPGAESMARMHCPGDPGELDFAPLERPLGIYPVVDSLTLLEALLQAGATVVQFRWKDQPAGDDRRNTLAEAVALGRRFQAQVVINDYWQDALELGAWGVHLGQDDLPGADLQALAAAGIRLGVSTHGYAELGRALSLKPSYIALGHVFATRTKAMPSQPQGLARLARYQQWVGDRCPTVAIGGIKAHHLADIVACGVSSVAVVTAITAVSEPVAAWRALDQQWQQLTEENRAWLSA
ncbi:MAG: thiamine phosphate synthase [Saccharospirillum sp.]|nr:thiamine phosphate synthase [Saccharospirillum sp.]